jgi:hypothetical protein
MNGFARIRCDGCGHERLLAFSCRCRGFCPSCQARRSEEWAAWLLEERLFPVVHHHVVFTLPKMLRIYFRFDRTLLNGLSRAAYAAIHTYIGALMGEGYVPGMIIARQTFGEGARFHPHLHAILTGGAWDAEGRWRSVIGWDRPVLRELFQVEVFRFLRERELLTAERMGLIRSWRHSGFDVYVGEPIADEDRATLGHVARYLLRPPISLERMRYDPQAEKVTLRPLAGERAEPVELEPLEFIARVVQHIPDVRERQVVYYGVYANATKRLPRRREEEGQGTSAGTLIPLEEPTPYQQRQRIRWAQLIQRVWLEDPLLCPHCGGEMRILAFITDPPLVDKILRHLGWHPGEPAPDLIRAPPATSPAMLKVAESPPKT